MPMSAMATAESMAAETSAWSFGVLPFEELSIGPSNRKITHADVILIVIAVLKLSCEEQKGSKRRGLAKSGLKRLYHIPILSKALDILELLQAEDEPLALEALYQRTRISKTSVYRILKPFVHRR